MIGLVAALGLLLQTTLLHVLPFGQPAPEIVLVLCVYLGLHHHTVGGVFGAFLLGYLQDSVSGSPPGLNAFGMVVVYVLVYLTCRRLWVDNVVSRVVLVFLASLVKTVAVVAFIAVFIASGVSWSATVGRLLVNATLAAVVAPPVFWLLARVRLAEEREAQ